MPFESPHKLLHPACVTSQQHCSLARTTKATSESDNRAARLPAYQPTDPSRPRRLSLMAQAMLAYPD
jgi:hypothetical protein